ncbi:hypothetical protein FMUND_13605 [Fusarium mundagurra]|uniref:Uncharacterized protein n=1 Tax=Fusarium mundagurra TaxID=1567541 RepID=A0A8H5XXI4_9HYPO|nr:hypothetical protein FMUND_13605 [Fusarium mundagurra]
MCVTDDPLVDPLPLSRTRRHCATHDKTALTHRVSFDGAQLGPYGSQHARTRHNKHNQGEADSTMSGLATTMSTRSDLSREGEETGPSSSGGNFRPSTHSRMQHQLEDLKSHQRTTETMLAFEVSSSLT